MSPTVKEGYTKISETGQNVEYLTVLMFQLRRWSYMSKSEVVTEMTSRPIKVLP